MAAQKGKASGLPTLHEIAEAIAAGETTVAEMAEGGGINAQWLRARMYYAGFNPDTGLPQQKKYEKRAPVPSVSLDWHTESACVGSDPSLWFAETPAEANRARAICRECPVRLKCLDWIMRQEDAIARYGIYGGLTGQERVQLARTKAGAA